MSTRVLLSPSEFKLAQLFGKDAMTSDLPESKGADILIYTEAGLVGLQRKEVPNDFLTSFTDGRMSRETALLVDNCKFTRLIAEGRFQYFPNGNVVLGGYDAKNRRPQASRFTRNHIRGMIFDLEFVKGIVVDWTEDILDTVAYIKALPTFLNKDKHLGLYTRPSAQGAWYVPNARDIDLWILQSFPGIGPTIADKIIIHFDGKIPLKWSCTLKQLEGVPGLSVKRAGLLWESLPHVESSLELLRDRVKRRLSD